MNYRRMQVFKHLSYTVLLLFLYVLQTTPRLFEISGGKPMLVIAGAIGIAMFEGEFLGGIYGAIAGLLCDTAGYALFGYTGFMLCLLCIAIGLLVEYLMQPTLFTYVVYVFAAMMLIHTISFIFTYGIWRLPSLTRLYLKKVVFSSIYTAVASPILYYFTRFLQRRFYKSLKYDTRA